MTVLSCSFKSRIVNSPFSSFFIMFSCRSGFAIAISCARSTSPCMSPMPSILEMNGWGENFSRSCRCSPVPMKMIGVLVAATLFPCFGGGREGESVVRYTL